MVERLIFIDLDCTLIDSEKRYEDEKQIAERFWIPREVYEQAVGELYQKHGGASRYSFSLICDIIHERTGWTREGLLKGLALLLSKNYFFPDSLSFLAQFPREEFVLVTSGNPDFQWPKIRTHGLADRVKSIFVTNDKPAVVAGEKRAGVVHFFIDDAPKEIEKMKRAHPDITCIQIRTPASWEKQRHTDFADARLPDLIAAAEFIKRKTVRF